MYNSNDTIAAVSSPSNEHRVIVRVSGPQTLKILNQVFTQSLNGSPGITSGKIMNLDCMIYFFRSPRSYTGDDLAEIHLWANQAIVEKLMEKLLSLGARAASAGEFTARAYLNNKIDLAQAEAVNEVITASNTFQLAAAENLLAGRLGRLSRTIRESILDILSKIEANLDFSTEDIVPASKSDIIAKLNETINRLNELIAGSIRSRSTLELPAVGIAGTPNAGKSTLLNKLLGRQRSIVSHQQKTTRDVLTGELELPGCRCILFDCAGLLIKTENILDELAQQAAIEAIRNAMAIIFCVDISKADWAEDTAIRQLINQSNITMVATKIDLVSEKEAAERLVKLKTLFDCDFLAVSAKSGTGIDTLKSEISRRIVSAAPAEGKNTVALTVRHRQAINNAIHDIIQAEKEIKAGSEELAAMMLRTACNQLSNIEQHNIEEQVLDRIFSRFCIGK